MNSKIEKTLENAEAVIERFGGIRPMSSKTDIPVTTIQGWKKRNAIPSSRTEDIVKAAEENGIRIADLIQGSGANENGQTDRKTLDKAVVAKAITLDPTDDKVTRKSVEQGRENEKEKAQEKRAHDVAEILTGEPLTLSDGIKDEVMEMPAKKPAHQAAQGAAGAAGKPDHADKAASFTPKALADQGVSTVSLAELEERLNQVQKKAVTKSAVLSVVVTTLIVGAVAALLVPKAQKAGEQLDANTVQIAEMRGQMQDMQEQGVGGFVGSMIPQEWKDQIGAYQTQAAALAEQAKVAQEQVGAVLKRAEEISSDVIGGQAGNLQERVARLEAHLGQLGFNPDMGAFMGKISALRTSTDGQALLDRTVSELSSLFEGFDGTPETLEGYLNDVRQKSPTMAETFEGVPADDLKAAALLLTMEQLRSALNRDGQAFGDDLQLMKNLVGAQDNELSVALDRLAPRAETGVLSVSGLSDELRGLAGEAVVASLKGESVDLNEKARARMNDLFSVEKDGALVTGTDTQAKMAKTQNLMDAGKLDEAIATAETLDGDAAGSIASWLEKAKATSAAQSLRSILDYNIDLQVSGKTPAEAASGLVDAVSNAAGRMIYDPKSGYRIFLPPASGNNAENLAAPKGLKTE